MNTRPLISSPLFSILALLTLGAATEFVGMAGCGGGNLNTNLKVLASNVVYNPAVPSALASQQVDTSGVDTQTKVLAGNVVYDASASTLDATNVQSALDDLTPDYATAIAGTWTGDVFCAPSTSNEADEYRALGFETVGNSEILVKLSNGTATFTAQTDTEDGTYSFNVLNFFLPQTGSFAELTGTFRVIGHHLYFQVTVNGSVSNQSLPEIIITGNTMEFLSHIGGKCTAFLSKSSLLTSSGNR